MNERAVIPRRPRTKRVRPPNHKPINAGDLPVLTQIYRYNRLNTSYIAALADQKQITTQKALTRLRNETQGRSEHYVTVDMPSLNNENIYRADTKLEPFLAEHNIRPDRATLLSFNGGSRGAYHDLMVANVTANIELGMRGTGYSLVTPEEILRSPGFAGKADGARHQFSIMVTGADYQGRIVPPFELVPDNVFGIEGPNGIVFFALECEHMNTARSNDLSNNSALRKMIGYRAISKHINGAPLYRQQWGLPNLVVMFIKPTDEQVETLKFTLRELCGDSPQFIFATSPIMRDKLPYFSPKPDREMFTRAWARVGHPDFSLMI